MPRSRDCAVVSGGIRHGPGERAATPGFGRDENRAITAAVDGPEPSSATSVSCGASCCAAIELSTASSASGRSYVVTTSVSRIRPLACSTDDHRASLRTASTPTDSVAKSVVAAARISVRVRCHEASSGPRPSSQRCTRASALPPRLAEHEFGEFSLQCAGRHPASRCAPWPASCPRRRVGRSAVAASRDRCGRPA